MSEFVLPAAWVTLWVMTTDTKPTEAGREMSRLVLVQGGRNGVDRDMAALLAGIRAATAADPLELERFLTHQEQILRRRENLRLVRPSSA